MKKYPEHDKLKKISDKSQTIGEFIEWLIYEKNVQLCRFESCEGDAEHARYAEYFPLNVPITKLLAEYFGIDEKKIEEEKRASLEELRKLNTMKGE
jgi:hypothetical protein